MIGDFPADHKAQSPSHALRWAFCPSVAVASGPGSIRNREGGSAAKSLVTPWASQRLPVMTWPSESYGPSSTDRRRFRSDRWRETSLSEGIGPQKARATLTMASPLMTR